MTEAQAGGLLDLEKELTCSICTEVLFEPLTLLDCLHTFCGSCLKDWFSFQASKASSPRPYTCPSCRASVRDTKRNAQVTTLLDLFLQANPSRARSEEEIRELGKKYKQGDNVLPEVDLETDSEDDVLMEEVRQRSLQEVGIPLAKMKSTGQSRSHTDATDTKAPEVNRMSAGVHPADLQAQRGRTIPLSKDASMLDLKARQRQHHLRALLVSQSLGLLSPGRTFWKQPRVRTAGIIAGDLLAKMHILHAEAVPHLTKAQSYLLILRLDGQHAQQQTCLSGHRALLDRVPCPSVTGAAPILTGYRAKQPHQLQHLYQIRNPPKHFPQAAPRLAIETSTDNLLHDKQDNLHNHRVLRRQQSQTLGLRRL
ncbi:MAG: hypothetical protein M1822_007799 [Bathelium mastoideum]|nr:MAG: hypothetical protein M1822_007799 [Bathelium mastoideum]